MRAVDIRSKEILKRISGKAVGVEVGVFRGNLSQNLLLNNQDLFLHMVDSWTTGNQEYIDSGDYHASLTQKEQDKYHQDAITNTEFAADRRKIWRMDSVEAAKHFKDKSLDFVFIDADHSYEGCKRDIEAWRSKLKDTGILCGHDYDNDNYEKFGVKRAVDELNEQLELGDDYTWFIREHLTVACVKWGDKYPAEYVNILHAMVTKNLNRPFDFVCLTDNPEGLDEHIKTVELKSELKGWWNKIELFNPALFTKGRILYLDLDVCITGSLDELADSHGIIFDWHLPTYNSSVMVWKAGDHSDVYTKFTHEIADKYHGDQDWITELAGWPILPANWCVSYRSHAQDWPPASAKVVCFHGDPKPHEFPSKWVKSIWSLDGLSGVRFDTSLNNDRHVMLMQFEQNLKRDLPILREQPEHSKTMIIVGGSPSLAETYTDFPDGDVFALNATHDWLIDKGIIPDYHVMLDSRIENAEFVLNARDDVHYLISAFCHPSVFDLLADKNVTMWMSDMEGVLPLVQHLNNPMLVGGGATVGMKAMFMGYLMGYRDFHLFGMDSCYQDGKNHAYPQKLNDGEQTISILACGREFTCAPWMAKQAAEFQKQARMLINLNCSVKVHGDGLLSWIMSNWNK
jgi:uncharacterized Rossmann fold enzyme